MIRDTRGAITVLGVFLAVFLAAMLYYVVGIAEAIAERQGMQDAADAAALSAAIVHARGMNLIALINMLMAGLLAILVALKLAEAVLIIVAVVALALSWINPGFAAIAPVAEAYRAEVSGVHDDLEEPVNQGLEALNLLARAVRYSVPFIAHRQAGGLIARHYAPPARYGFALPTRATLPTVDGEFDQLCDKAGEVTGMLVGLSIPGDWGVDDLLGDAIGSLAAGAAGWFCGDGGSPPSTDVEYEITLPELPSRAACSAQTEINVATYDPIAHAETCAQAGQEEELAAPDDTGNCQYACEPDGPYATRIALAREACAPADPDPLYDFTWQKQRWSRRYLWDGERWQRTRDARLLESEVMRDTARPCGGDDALIGDAWHRQRENASDEAIALCSDERAPSGRPRNPTEHWVGYTAVGEIFGCKQRTTRHFEIAANRQDDHIDGTSQRQGRSKNPQAMEEGVELGEEPFQVRAFVLGGDSQQAERAVRRVGRARWGRGRSATESHADNADNTDNPYGDLRALGALSVAQAEYYYAVEDPQAPEREAWLWNLHWRARLRRFRWPAMFGAEQTEDRSDDGDAELQDDDSFLADLLPLGELPVDIESACRAAMDLADGDNPDLCAAIDASWLDDLILH